MRVLQVVTAAGPGGVYGGPTTVATEQCWSLVARGIEARLAAGWLATEVPDSLDGVDGVFIPMKPLTRRFMFSSAYSVGAERVLRDQVGWADVVHIHYARDLVPLRAAAVASRLRVPFVVQTHGMVVPDSRSAVRLIDWLAVRRQLSRASHVLALTETEARQLRDVGLPTKPRLLPNGITLRDVRPSERRANEVLFLALLKGTKRPLHFVQAAHRLIDMGRLYDFRVVGPDSGELRALQDYISTHRLDRRVQYEGAIPRADVHDRLAKAAVYVLPSSYDPFPMSVLEALAARTPVILSPECGQASDLREMDAAEVVEGDPDALALAIDKLMSDEELRRRRALAGFRFVRDRLSIEAVVDSLVDVYESAIAGARA